MPELTVGTNVIIKRGSTVERPYSRAGRLQGGKYRVVSPPQEGKNLKTGKSEMQVCVGQTTSDGPGCPLVVPVASLKQEGQKSGRSAFGGFGKGTVPKGVVSEKRTYLKDGRVRRTLKMKNGDIVSTIIAG